MMRLKLTHLIAAILLSPAMVMAANLDGEEIPTNEAQAIHDVSKLIATQVTSEANKNGHAFRDAHRKQHGCVNAQFEVLDQVPARLKQGLFAEAANYSAVIRFSNGSGQAQDDHQGDGRGMAVKVLGVNGERNLDGADDETTSQDFLMVNHPVFFVRNAADYVQFQKAVVNGDLMWWLISFKHVFHESWIAKTILGKKMVNPLEANYFSMTASKLGSTQMKFRAKPCPGSQLVNVSDSINRLRENLAATLVGNEACFLFQVQERLKPRDMPIEDPTIEWRESDSQFITVAKITIAKQAPYLGEKCEVLSFNPWNGLKEHRPLGGISRTRKEVYQTISRLRHDFNKQSREEPRN